MEDGRLTDEAFWDKFWAGTRLPAIPSPANPFERAFREVLAHALGAAPGTAVAEIGCAPGKWLSHCALVHGATVTGYESSPEGAALTRENFRLLGIRGTVVEADFLQTDLSPRFDLVMSLGLIEHFEDPSEVVAGHVKLMRPGGLLLLEVPNLRGLNLRLLEWTKSDLLAHHNTDVMTPESLDGLARAHGLGRIGGAYVGGFEPAYFDMTTRGITARAALSLIGRARRRVPPLARLNGRAWSGYLYGLYRKPAATS